jgi:hypothetical protein
MDHFLLGEFTFCTELLRRVKQFNFSYFVAWFGGFSRAWEGRNIIFHWKYFPQLANLIKDFSPLGSTRRELSALLPPTALKMCQNRAQHASAVNQLSSLPRTSLKTLFTNFIIIFEAAKICHIIQ